jgi:hypothetical protein
MHQDRVWEIAAPKTSFADSNVLRPGDRVHYNDGIRVGYGHLISSSKYDTWLLKDDRGFKVTANCYNHVINKVPKR